MYSPLGLGFLGLSRHVQDPVYAVGPEESHWKLWAVFNHVDHSVAMVSLPRVTRIVQCLRAWEVRQVRELERAHTWSFVLCIGGSNNTSLEAIWRHGQLIWEGVTAMVNNSSSRAGSQTTQRLARRIVRPEVKSWADVQAHLGEKKRVAEGDW